MTPEKVNSYLPILSVVKAFLNERNEKSLTNIERYLQMAIEGWSDMSIFEMNAVNVAYLDVVDNVAQLPSDFITHTKIGVRICGKMWTLTQNNDILIPRPETICPNDIETVCCTPDYDYTNLGSYFFFPHYRYGTYIDTLYGISGGFNTAYYRIDMENRLIYFNGCVPNDEVILEYKSSGVTSGSIIIPRQAIPALKAYLHWKTILYDPRVADNMKMNLERLYNFALTKLHALECSFTLNEFLDAMYSSYSQSPKR